jgi:hypothetical protein
MMMTRRRVLLGSMSVPAAFMLRGASAQAQTAPLRISLTQFLQDQAKLNALRRGIAEMKRRRPSDPTSWFYQAAVHGVTDEAVEQAVCDDSEVANVDQARFWNQCPHFGQTSANFLVWHRAYLYYFERILRAASGDASFALPYWDYTVANGRAFPPAFAPEYLDPPSNTWPNPLYHPERELAVALGVVTLSEGATSIADILNEKSFFASVAGNSFAGNANTSDQGKIERRPHNGVHFAVGGVIGSIGGAMASVTTAAFDPIFWVHHAMIDRLWVEWACLPDRNWGSLPARAWLDEAPWAFNDVDGTIKEEPRRRFFDHRTLNYRYDVEHEDCSPLALPEEILVAGSSVAPPAASVVLAEQPAMFVVVDAPLVQRLAAPPGSPPMLAAADIGSVILEIANVGIEGVPLNGYDVYLLADASASHDRSSAGYLGSLALFGVGEHQGGGHHSQTQRFDATAAVSAIPAGSEPVVVIEPFSLVTSSPAPAPEALASGLAPPRNAGKITFSALRLVGGE